MAIWLRRSRHSGSNVTPDTRSLTIDIPQCYGIRESYQVYFSATVDCNWQFHPLARLRRLWSFVQTTKGFLAAEPVCQWRFYMETGIKNSSSEGSIILIWFRPTVLLWKRPESPGLWVHGKWLTWKLLVLQENILAFEKLHEISVSSAKGIAYLYEECQQKIVHYGIKPKKKFFWMKISCRKWLISVCPSSLKEENTHITMTGRRRSPGYAAPELLMAYPVTRKCDVYSFGMLLLEFVGWRRNMDKDTFRNQRMVS